MKKYVLILVWGLLFRKISRLGNFKKEFLVLDISALVNFLAVEKLVKKVYRAFIEENITAIIMINIILYTYVQYIINKIFAPKVLEEKEFKSQIYF